MKLLLSVVFIIGYSITSVVQQKEKCKAEVKDRKTLVIINGHEKMWTLQEKHDSINYSQVKSMSFLTDSIARIKQYGEKAKYGALIVTYKDKEKVKTKDGDKCNSTNNEK